MRRRPINTAAAVAAAASARLLCIRSHSVPDLRHHYDILPQWWGHTGWGFEQRSLSSSATPVMCAERTRKMGVPRFPPTYLCLLKSFVEYIKTLFKTISGKGPGKPRPPNPTHTRLQSVDCPTPAPKPLACATAFTLSLPPTTLLRLIEIYRMNEPGNSE